jgi:soluble lytic murein transglycosylase-like protein
MSEVKTSRPFQERFLDGFDRQLEREVKKTTPKRFRWLRKKYAMWALGAGLALGGGLGVPVAGHMRARAPLTWPRQIQQPPQPEAQPLPQQIATDVRTAQQIADEVAGGVRGAVTTVAESAARAPVQIGTAVAQAPQQVVQIVENVKQDFFNREVPFGQIIYSEAKKNDLPPELVAAVVNTESKFVPTARSHAGAVGLMQLEPRTGRWMGATDLTDPAENISAGARYLRYLTDRFAGNQEKAIAAYNAGEGAVRRFNGIPPFRETRDYVLRVQDFQRDLGQRVVSQIAEGQGVQPGL